MKIKLYQCGGENAISEYPLGLGYLKTNCKKADIEIVKNKKDLKECDLIGLSANAWGLKEAIQILEISKIPIILGGQGVLWEPIKNYNFKHIVYGDGETSLNNIIDGTKEKLLHNRITNLDDLEFPDRGNCNFAIPIITSRGCPKACSFCSAKTFWGNVRFHSAKYFIREVCYILEKYPQAKELRIMDDLFIGHKKRFLEIYEYWMSKGLNKKLKLKSFVRSDLLTLEIGQKMKNMGFYKFRFGGESGSNRILKLLNKQETVEDHQKAIDVAKQLKVPITATFMYDIPGETKKDIKLTQDFINKNKGKLKIEGYYKFRSFPGISLYDGSSPLKINMNVR